MNTESLLPVGLARRSHWSDTDVDVVVKGSPIEQVRIATIGGGLASFAVVDQLRIRGTPAREVAVVTELHAPYEQFRHYARHSQINDTDRIRSDSGSRTESPWGFPGYAAEEAWQEHRPGPVVRALVEPILVPYHTPRARQVYGCIDREASRIGWASMRREGHAVAVRRRHGGGFFVAYLRPDGTGMRVLRAEAVHLGTGHSGLQRAAASISYRDGSGDLVRVVHAYEPHEHVYRALAELENGTVAVLGAGITASQVVARIAQDRQRLDLATRVVRVTREHPLNHLEMKRPRRRFRDGIAIQPFSAPRAAFGGEIQQRLQRTAPEKQRELRELIARPTTPDRRSWAKLFDRASAEGWYLHVVGEVIDITGVGGDGLRLTWDESDGSRGSTDADFVVECTGFHTSPPVPALAIGVLVDAPRADQLTVDESFAVVGTRDSVGGGAVYVSGAAAGDGPIGTRDSFWGMQDAAIRIADNLAAAGLTNGFGSLRSIRGWSRWLRNQPV
jgi:cation diffusion facilitator CzcD-associated flavoprotein CzcO